MVAVHSSTEQVEGEPASLVLMLCLICQSRCGERLSKILGLYQQRIRADSADRLHGEHRCRALGQEGSYECRAVGSVRVPVPVEAAEPSRRERFVHGRVEADPGVPACYSFGVVGEKLRKLRIEKVRITWSAPVRAGRRDDLYAELAQATEALVMPFPVALVRRVRRNRLPEDRITNGSEAKAGYGIEVIGSIEMTRFPTLISKAVTNPRDGALQAAPNFGPA